MRITVIWTLIGLVAIIAAGSAEAKEWKTVRIGMDATYAPFESVDAQGNIVGFEVDYGNALCAKMHVTCTFQNQDWDGIIPALLSGKFDVIFSQHEHDAGPRAECAVLRHVLRDPAGLGQPRPATRATTSRPPR